ncbi:MAG: DNA alkylation repair protein [Anaerolineae bacterium]
MDDPLTIATAHLAEIEALPVKNTPNERVVHRKLARELSHAKPDFVLAVARELHRLSDEPGHAYALLSYHKPTFDTLGEVEIQEFGQGINSWWTVDGFARSLAGPAWLRQQISDEVIHTWARSEDRWWRRAALVSTVALNIRSKGGYGDVRRTLEVCEMLADDQDDMVIKALSWALRALVVHDPDVVRGFLAEHDDLLAARVKREVTNKLTTGLKNPRRHAPRGTAS